MIKISCHSLTMIDLVGWQQNASGPSEVEFEHKNRETLKELKTKQ